MASTGGARRPPELPPELPPTTRLPASEVSIAWGSAPVEGPDFTRGKWQTRKPGFAIEA